MDGKWRILATAVGLFIAAPNPHSVGPEEGHMAYCLDSGQWQPPQRAVEVAAL